MALVVTVAGASSDSYASLAQADAYAVEVDSSTWNALGDAAKENYLKRATRAIDRFHYSGWKYDVETVTAGQPLGQRLQFPRHIDIDGAGSPYLPTEVVECCCAVAVALSEGASESSSDATVKRMKAGKVEIEFDTADGSSVTASTISETIRDILGHRMASSVGAI